MCVRTVLCRVALTWTIFCLAFVGPARAGQLTASSVPSPWTAVDIGFPSLSGSSNLNQGVFTISAAGSDVWNYADQFHFVYQLVAGDVDIRARVDAITYADAWSKVGVMIRGSLGASSAHGFMLASAGKGLAFQCRTVGGGISTSTPGDFVTPPRWVRLVRAGSQLTSYSSVDGVTWTIVGVDTVQLPTSAYVGIAVVSHNASVLATGTVSQVSILRQALPAGQSETDIGAPDLKGSTTYTGGMYTITAGGADIWGTTDQFHYVYQQMTGDLDVKVRIASVSATDRWSKAGVMIRQSLSADSAHAFALISSQKGDAFQRRTANGDKSVNSAGTLGAAPGWVRLKRSGPLVTAYQSADGVNWTVIGSDNIVLTDPVYVGLAATSHNTAVSVTAVLDNYAIAQLQGSPSPDPTTTPAPSGPTTLGFTVSTDDASVSAYVLEVFPVSVNVATASPSYLLPVGKPTADASGNVSVDITTFFNALPAGSYQATVTANWSGGSARSDPISLTR